MFWSVNTQKSRRRAVYSIYMGDWVLRLSTVIEAMTRWGRCRQWLEQWEDHFMISLSIFEGREGPYRGIEDYGVFGMDGNEEGNVFLEESAGGGVWCTTWKFHFLWARHHWHKSLGDAVVAVWVCSTSWWYRGLWNFLVLWSRSALRKQLNGLNVVSAHLAWRTDRQWEGLTMGVHVVVLSVGLGCTRVFSWASHDATKWLAWLQ